MYLSAESQPGAGSTFIFGLELEIADEQPVDLPPGAPLHNILVIDDNLTNCLVVEDEPVNMMLISEVLRNMGVDRRLPVPMRNAPIIALTADAIADDKERCLQAGMDNFISKPFRMEEITAMLKKHLS